jgi:hypothetical protein
MEVKEIEFGNHSPIGTFFQKWAKFSNWNCSFGFFEE